MTYKRITALVIMCCLVFSACSNGAAAPTAENGTPVTLSFISTDRDQNENLIVTETRMLPTTDEKQLPQAALDALFAGPQNSRADQIIPSNLSVSSLTNEDGRILLTLTLSGQKPNEDFDFLMVKTSVALTLLSLPGVNEVGVYLNNIAYEDGQPTDLFTLSQIITPQTLNNSTQQKVMIYIPDSKAGLLKADVRTLPGSTEDNLFSGIVAEVMKTDDNTNIGRSFYNQNARLLSALLEDGQLTINFSEPVQPQDAGEEQTKLCLFGLVNSLCRQNDVSSVRILIAGKPYDSYLPFAENDVYTANSALVAQ